MVYSLSYRRPSHVASSRDSLSGEKKQSSINDSISSGSSAMSHGIPDALSFDRIIAGGVCPPCTVRDFMNYLRYIEHSAENLQIHLWYREYSARWKQLPESQKALAPEWTEAQAEAESAGYGASRPRKVNPQVAAILVNTEFADAPPKAPQNADPFNTPPKSPSMEEKHDMMSEDGCSTGDEKTLASSTARFNRAEQAFNDAGMKLMPFTTQPYRDEISRIIAIYIAKGSPRELNISDRERQAVLHALQSTTHPSAFRSVMTPVEYSLRKQSHPNFIRWTICNGNRPRVIFARGLGISVILAGLVVDLIITLSSAGRGWRVLPFAGWFIGIATLIAATKGMCVVLHGMHHRHLRPWELFSDDAQEVDDEKTMSRLSQDTLVSTSTNSFEDEPWVAKYRKRNVIRKIFDREIWIKEPALRQIQDTIFLQAVLCALILSCVFVGIFCAVPHGNFF